jgi:hypothetical protein
MKFHICFTCLHAQDFSKPMSMTTENHLHMTFECLYTPYRDAYGHIVDTNAMIYDFITGKCWVDGGESVPLCGCSHYKKYIKVNDEVITEYNK